MAKIPISRGLAYHLFCEPTQVEVLRINENSGTGIKLLLCHIRNKALDNYWCGAPVVLRVLSKDSSSLGVVVCSGEWCLNGARVGD